MSISFNINDFGLEVVAKGSYIDTKVGNGHNYIIEAIVVRLNPALLQAWLDSECFNTLNNYDTYEEWLAHKAPYDTAREICTTWILAALGLSDYAKHTRITPSQAEVFTVVHICEVA